MIQFNAKGSFKKTNRYLNNVKKVINKNILEKYAEEGLEALKNNTPKDTGLTSESWYYEINIEKDRAQITWLNSNVVDHTNIAIILHYGHATNNGGFVQGIDYINPALKDIFEGLANEIWREVKKA